MWRKKQAAIFTGTCYVREHTADGYAVGACFGATYDGICQLHGDVTEYLRAIPWPADYQLPKYDGQSWAEQLRARQANLKRGNGS